MIGIENAIHAGIKTDITKVQTRCDDMAISDKINKLLYPDEEQKNKTQQKAKAYLTNPFLRRDGSLANKYLNYQSIIDNPATTEKVKKYITEATGVVPTITNTTESKEDSTEPNATTTYEQSAVGADPFTGKIGVISAKYEAGGWNPGRVSSGNGDHGGVSYGMPQFSTTQGSAQSFVNWLKQKNPEIGNAFGNYSPGTTEFTNVWKNVAAQYGDTFGNLPSTITCGSLAYTAGKKVMVEYFVFDKK